MPFIDHPLVKETLEDPPYSLDVVVVEGDVRIVHIKPVPDPLSQAPPLLFICEDRLAAFLVEPLDPVFLDILLGTQAQLFLDLYLNRQSMSIPSGLSVDLVSSHGLVPAHYVLECPGEDMVNARPAICSRRAFIKDPPRAALSQRNTLVGDVVFAPILKYRLFSIVNRLLWVNLFEYAHATLLHITISSCLPLNAQPGTVKKRRPIQGRRIVAVPPSLTIANERCALLSRGRLRFTLVPINAGKTSKPTQVQPPAPR